jgi:hypothetical protein
MTSLPAEQHTRVRILSNHENTRRLAEAIQAQNPDQERLFQLIASLANCLDRDVVVGTMQYILATEPVVMDDCVLFDDVAVRFGDDGRVRSLYRVIDGNKEPAVQGALPGRAGG